MGKPVVNEKMVDDALRLWFSTFDQPFEFDQSLRRLMKKVLEQAIAAVEKT